MSSNPRGSGSTSNSGASNWILSGNQGNSQNKDNKSQTVVRVWWLIPIVLVQGKGKGKQEEQGFQVRSRKLEAILDYMRLCLKIYNNNNNKTNQRKKKNVSKK